MAGFEFTCALVVDSEATIADDLNDDEHALCVEHVYLRDSASAGLMLLSMAPDLIVIEAEPADRSGRVQLVEAARASTASPVVIVVGRETEGALVAELLRAGADAYLEKPVTLSVLAEAVLRERDGERLCAHMARLLVGRLSLKDAIQKLRGTMHSEALCRTGGSRRGASVLLGIDRRCVQRMVDEFGGPPGRSMMKAPRPRSFAPALQDASRPSGYPDEERTALRSRIPSGLRKAPRSQSG